MDANRYTSVGLKVNHLTSTSLLQRLFTTFLLLLFLSSRLRLLYKNNNERVCLFF